MRLGNKPRQPKAVQKIQLEAPQAAVADKQTKQNSHANTHRYTHIQIDTRLVDTPTKSLDSYSYVWDVDVLKCL